MPMLRAVPAMILIPAASSLAFMSAFLIFQISASCFFVTLPTLSWFGFAEPEAMLAAFFRSTEAGGDFRMNVKLLSVNTVITTGRIMPFWSLVRALKPLQNAWVLRRGGAGGGPRGGAGFAGPAGKWGRM